MNISISRAALLPALAAACAVAPKHGPTAALRLTARDRDGLTVTACDPEVSVRLTVVCTVEKPGEVYVPAHDLLRVLKGASADTATLQVVGGNRLAVRVGGAVTRLPLADDPWSEAPAPEGAEIAIEGAALARILRIVAPAVAPDAARRGLNGIHLEMAGEHLRAVATDGHRLHAADAVTFSTPAIPEDQLIPPRAAKLITDAAIGPCRLVLAHGWGALHHASGELRFRLLDGEFPAYHGVVPVVADTRHTLTLDRLDFVAALRRAEIGLEAVEKVTRLEIDGDGVRIRTASPDRDHDERVTGAVDGHPVAIGARGEYLREALAHHTGDTVSLLMTHPLAPILIEDQAAFFVIMPMRLD